MNFFFNIFIWKNIPTSLTANSTFRTPIYTILFQNVSQLKNSSKSLFYYLNPVQMCGCCGGFWVCFFVFLYNVILSSVRKRMLVTTVISGMLFLTSRGHVTSLLQLFLPIHFFPRFGLLQRHLKYIINVLR